MLLRWLLVLALINFRLLALLQLPFACSCSIQTMCDNALVAG